MKPTEINSFNIGPRLTFTFVLLLLLIVGGNGLLIWQFQTARVQTLRSSGVSEQLIAVLQLQQSLLSFHLRLDELGSSHDAHRLVTEGKALQRTLLEQTQRTRSALTSSSSQNAIDPALLPTLQAIEITLPTQVEVVSGLAESGDWGAVRLRLGNELKPLETQTSVLVERVHQQVSRERMQAVANMEVVLRRILVIVPATAVLTFCIAAFFGWSIARRMIELRLEERVGERTRIARELHDTLLQSFQGVLLQLEAITYMLEDRPDAREGLEKVIDHARQAIVEGRDAVQGLRVSTEIANDLARAISKMGEELAESDTSRPRPDVSVHVEGVSRDLVPVLRDDVYRITGEALRNAFHHANASRIEVEISYGGRHFRVRIRDNGKGIAPAVLDTGSRDGHYGLPGMYERTKLIGGKLDVRSQPNSGTVIDLTVPASVAYARSDTHPKPKSVSHAS